MFNNRNLKKISYWINWVQFKTGELFFPIFEPFLRMFDDKNPEIRNRLDQAVQNLENKNIEAALADLNMVLNLRPNHFLARVYRGRIYIRAHRYRLAVEDYIQAHKISRYRFIHYDLYNEYFASMNHGIGRLSSSIIQNFNQAFEILRYGKESSPKAPSLPRLDSNLNPEDSPELMTGGPKDDKPWVFTEKERAKFLELNPITEQEIRKTDWDQLSKDLSSKAEDL